MTNSATPRVPGAPVSALEERKGEVAPDVTAQLAEASERLAALEAELAFQTDTCRELSDALATQQLDMLTLQRQVRYLSEQLVALRERDRRNGTEAPDDEKPPHY
ncbi:MAG: SlyX family protein [Pseudomonadota bacterium]